MLFIRRKWFIKKYREREKSMKKSQINVFLAAGVVALLLLSGCVSGIVSTFQSTTTDTSATKKYCYK